MPRRKPNKPFTCTLCGRHSAGYPGRRVCTNCHPALAESQGKARLIVKLAIEEGRLAPITQDTKCTDCDKPAREYDHRDYNKPLDVDPVCRGCNLKRGSGIPMSGSY